MFTWQSKRSGKSHFNCFWRTVLSKNRCGTGCCDSDRGDSSSTLAYGEKIVGRFSDFDEQRLRSDRSSLVIQFRTGEARNCDPSTKHCSCYCDLCGRLVICSSGQSRYAYADCLCIV